MCTCRNLVLLSLHSSTIDGQWWVLGVTSPEVVSAPCGQKVDFLPVVSSFMVMRPTRDCVVRKLHHVIGAVGWCAVVCQQDEEQGTKHTALGRPCAHCEAV